MNRYRTLLPLVTLLLAGCLTLALLPASLVRAAPVGHQLPFAGTYPVLEGPGAARNDEDDTAMRSRATSGIAGATPVPASVSMVTASKLIANHRPADDAAFLQCLEPR